MHDLSEHCHAYCHNVKNGSRDLRLTGMSHNKEIGKTCEDKDAKCFFKSWI